MRPHCDLPGLSLLQSDECRAQVVSIIFALAVTMALVCTYIYCRAAGKGNFQKGLPGP